MLGQEREIVDKAARVVEAVAPIMPLEREIFSYLSDAQRAQQRGYYLPGEDERVRELYACYLDARVLLLEVIELLSPIFRRASHLQWADRLRVFGVAFAAAAMLCRVATYFVELGRELPVLVAKLDEAEPRFGIERGSFTRIYKSLASTSKMWRFYEATRYYDANQLEVEEALVSGGWPGVAAILIGEEEFLETRKAMYLKRQLDYRLYSFKRRQFSGYTKVMFHLFRLSGSVIAELKQPLVKPLGEGKRVTAEVRERVQPLLMPGDVLVTRHEDALSNLFLPGYWPHAALYLGTEGQRAELGLVGGKLAGAPAGTCVLEAKKDGVLFRCLDETLHVDAFLVLRPLLKPEQILAALKRAISHEGKLYDFLFDFKKADRLACTELIYRSYDSVEGVEFELCEHKGRWCLSAEDLLRQALDRKMFRQVLEFNKNGGRILTSSGSCSLR